MVKRGEIYYNPQYQYPAGNTEDKLLIVLNTTTNTTNPIVLIPTTSNKSKTNFPDGCNKAKHFFYLNAGKDFFVNNTFVQLHILNGTNPIQQSTFQSQIDKKQIEFKGVLLEDTIQKILACIQSLKEDIDQDVFKLIFV